MKEQFQLPSKYFKLKSLMLHGSCRSGLQCVWRGVVWCDVVWCDVVWCGVVCVVWYDVVWCVWCGVCGVVCVVWYDVV